MPFLTDRLLLAILVVLVVFLLHDIWFRGTVSRFYYFLLHMKIYFKESYRAQRHRFKQAKESFRKNL